MSRPSPQTERICSIVDLLASNPRESLHLSEIARYLGISKAGCLPTLTALAHAGWLVRHPTNKTYRLGPAFISIGKSAELFNPASYAQQALEFLANETHCACLALVPSVQGLVIADIVNPSGSSNDWLGLKRGHFTRVAAPLGAALLLKASDVEIDSWLHGSSIQNYEEAHKLFLPALRVSQDRGFTVEMRLPMHETYLLAQRLMSEARNNFKDLLKSTARLAVDQLLTHEYLLGEVDEEKYYQPIAIDAPVYGSTGEVEMILAVTDMPEPISGSEVNRIGRLVRSVADDITQDFAHSYRTA